VKETFRVAVIGCGSIGKRHIGNLIARGVGPERIVALDTREDRRAEVTARFGVERVCAKFEEVLDEKAAAAIVCSPTSFHIPQATALVERGMDVLIEKPLGHNLDGVEALEAAVTRTGREALIAYCFRFSEHGEKLREVVQSGVVGEPLYVRGEFSEYLPDWHPWEDYRSFYMAKRSLGGGSLLDQSHVLDMAHFCLGEIASVYAFNGRVSTLEVEADDLAEMVVRFRSGLVGSIHQDMFGRQHKKYVEVKCARGNIVWDVYNLSVGVYHADDRRHETFTFGKDHQVMYLREIDHFLDVVRRAVAPRSGLADGIHGMRVLMAAERSAGSGREEKV
jgi:predicted dehydrogenase